MTHFTFQKAGMKIKVYAAIVNRSSAKLLHKVEVTLSEEQSSQMHIRNYATVFTFDPHAKGYIASLSEQSNRLSFRTVLGTA